MKIYGTYYINTYGSLSTSCLPVSHPLEGCSILILYDITRIRGVYGVLFKKKYFFSAE